MGLFAPARARADGNDQEIEALVNGTLAGELKKGQYQDAIDKLQVAKQACAGSSCTAKTRAKILVALGIVYASEKKPAEAKQAFTDALKEDPSATLVAGYATPDVQAAFDSAKGVPSTPPPPTPQTPTPPPSKEPQKKTCKHPLRLPRPWRSTDAYCWYAEGKENESAQKWTECSQSATQSLLNEETPEGRLLLGGCQERAGHLRDAIATYEAGSGTDFKSRSDKLKEKVPKLIIRKPGNATKVVVKLNSETIDASRLGGEIWVDPGHYTVRATGVQDGNNVEFEDQVEVGELEKITVEIKFHAAGASKDDGFDARIVSLCMTRSKTRDDFARCVAQGGKENQSTYNIRIGGEVTGYIDSDHVEVLTPGATFSLEDPTAGWGIGGSFLVDIVTAASADIVASASPRWTEIRYAPALNAHKRFGNTDLHLEGVLSHEPDYLATSVGGGFSVDLAQKTVTPSLGYDFGYDISGRAGTPFSVFSHKIIDHVITGGITFIVDKSTIFAPSGAAVIETGDSSKPYRYIPTFTSENAAKVIPGITVDSVAKLRQPERLLEQLPTTRQRFALAGLLAHRFTSATLRLEERLYIDTWGLKATTTNFRYSIDVSQKTRIWPELRFHAQLPVTFWQLAYITDRTSDGIRFPQYRTGDRELGPLMTGTVGAGIRRAFTDHLGLTLTGEVDYTRFLNHLYIKQRLGYFGGLAAEVLTE